MDEYAVFGHPIGHSLSPRIHRAFAAQLGERLRYDAIDVSADKLDDTLKAFFAGQGKGANITLPHKERVLRLAHSASTRARLAGAANTLIKQADGRIMADNTDGAALVQDLEKHFGSLQDKRLLILGAGGACRGALAALLAMPVAAVLVANRTRERAEALLPCFHYDPRLRVSGLNDIPLRPYDIIINATASGLQNSIPAIDDSLFRRCVASYDMLYGAGPTPFMSHHTRLYKAAHAVDGLGMLVRQAALSFQLWRQKMPDIQPVLAALRAELG